MTDKSKPRIGWVDDAKGIGIILVVYSHVLRGIRSAGVPISETFFHWSDTVAYSFHMPLFFFLAGMFFAPSFASRGARALLTEKATTILYPYVVWSLLQGTLEVALVRYTNGDLSVADVLAFAWQPRAQFWFLYALFLMFAVATVCQLVAGRCGMPLLLVVGAVLFAMPHLSVTSVLYPMANHLIYFALGTISMRHFSASIEATTSKTVLVVVLLVFAVAELAAVRYGAAGLVLGRVALGSIGIAATVAVSSRAVAAGTWRLVAALGRASMPIYLAHILAASGARIALLRGLAISDPVAHLLVGTVAGLSLPFALLQLCRTHGWMFLFEAPRRSVPLVTRLGENPANRGAPSSGAMY